MNRTRTIPALLAALAIAGGATLAGSAAQADAPAASKTLVAPARMSERDYVATIRKLLAPIQPAAQQQSDAQLIAGGKDICAQLSGGATWQDFMADIDRYDLDPNFHIPAVVAAVRTFCPAQDPILP